MSFKLMVCLFMFAFVGLTYSAQFLTEPYQHPDYPGQCYDQDANMPVPVGVTSNESSHCKWQRCEPDFRFIVTTCAPTGYREGCTVSKPDLSENYPRCCPKLVCKNY